MRLFKSMINKFFTLIWFLQRPKFWLHAFHLIKRKFLVDFDNPSQRQKAHKWASKHVVSFYDALTKLGITGEASELNDSILKEGKELADKSVVKMGGPGDLNLLFNSVHLIRPSRVIETGVAYGWSSLAILKAMSINGRGKLYSVDMPYPKMGNEAYVGIVVPKIYSDRWSLIREPDRYGLKKAIKMAGGKVSLCHYDSDKSWCGRDYAFPLLWNALEPGGLFISDDIQDNMYFSEFVKTKSIPFAITKSDEKFIGIIRKPLNL